MLRTLTALVALAASATEDDSSLTAVGWQRAHGLVHLFDPAGFQNPVTAVELRL